MTVTSPARFAGSAGALRGGAVGIGLMMLTLLAAGAAAGQEPLAGQALEDLVSDHTEFGAITLVGEASPYAEYFAPDGALHGRDNWGSYDGTWRIEDTCVMVDYAEDDQFDGCVLYRPRAGGGTETQRAGDSVWVPVEILAGNPADL